MNCTAPSTPRRSRRTPSTLAIAGVAVALIGGIVTLARADSTKGATSQPTVKSMIIVANSRTIGSTHLRVLY